MLSTQALVAMNEDSRNTQRKETYAQDGHPIVLHSDHIPHSQRHHHSLHSPLPHPMHEHNPTHQILIK